MLITIFGATGQVGKRVTDQALAKGYRVRAFGRNVEHLLDKDNASFTSVKGYVFDEAEVFHAVKGCDAVISALGGAFDGTDKTRSLGIKNIIRQMQQAGVKRIVALGGMGILDAGNHTYLMDAPGYPEMYLPVSREHLAAFQYLKESPLDWTFVCSPDILDKDATHQYITGTDHLPEPDRGKIAAGDLADCMLNELTLNRFIHHRVGISAL